MTPFLPFHLADIGDDEVAAVVATLRSGWLTSGARAREFEAAFAARLGVAHAVALNSATAALHLALDAIDLREGDEVIVPTMTFAASAEVVCYLRGVPTLVDCDPDTLTMRAEDAEPAITARTKAIMPVDYAGHPCDLDPIVDLAHARGAVVVEDAAHALPAEYRGRPIGAIADMTAFSFYATKTLTTGEGGMLTTDNADYADRIRVMSLHGISRHAWNRYAAEGSWKYDILRPGFKYNLTDIAASLGLVQLRRVEEMWAGRHRVAERYDRGFANVPEVRVPARRGDVRSSWHLYPIRLQTDRLRIGRDAFIEELRARGIGTSVHFIPLHLHPYYRETYGYTPDDFPNATQAYAELISLPIYPKLPDADVDRVVDTVADVVRRHRR